MFIIWDICTCANRDCKLMNTFYKYSNMVWSWNFWDLEYLGYFLINKVGLWFRKLAQVAFPKNICYSYAKHMYSVNCTMTCNQIRNFNLIAWVEVNLHVVSLIRDKIFRKFIWPHSWQHLWTHFMKGYPQCTFPTDIILENL